MAEKPCPDTVRSRRIRGKKGGPPSRKNSMTGFCLYGDRTTCTLIVRHVLHARKVVCKVTTTKRFVVKTPIQVQKNAAEDVKIA